MGNIGKENPTLCANCQTTLIDREYFNVISNNLIDGRCPNCDKKLEGVFK